MSTKAKQKQASAATRNTIQRVLVLETVKALSDHPSSAEIFEKVRKKHPHISRATVYRNLDVLAEKGEVNRIEVPNGAARYDIPSHPHYHIKCHRCARIFDVDMPYMEDLQGRIGDVRGFRVDGHQIMFEGICPDCQEESTGPAV